MVAIPNIVTIIKLINASVVLIVPKILRAMTVTGAVNGK
jgi:hypothetical protein